MLSVWAKSWPPSAMFTLIVHGYEGWSPIARGTHCRQWPEGQTGKKEKAAALELGRQLAQ